MRNEKKITVGLIGNPNTGKSTIFNSLTGIKQHTGNWPGVTVEKKVGYLEHKGFSIEVVDLPGIYSLTSFQIDEKITRDFIVKEKPDVIVYIVDATNIERSLYLLLQILELHNNIVVVFNMIDLARKKGIEIELKTFEKILDVFAIATVGTKGIGINELKEKIISAYKSPKQGFTLTYTQDIEDAITRLSEYIERMKIEYPARFVALRLLDEDMEFYDIIVKSEYKDEILGILDEVREKYDDVSTFIAEKKYGFLHGLTKEFVKKRIDVESKMDITDKIDRIITNRFLGIPLFLVFLFGAFWIIFNAGVPFTDFIQSLIENLQTKANSWLESLHLPRYLISFITDGIISGVGTIITFAPNIFIFYIIFGLMEDSGYMPRAAFVMDKLMHTLGLHGKSFIPMILGFGCNVPAVLGSRILDSEKDRVLTILTIPFMSCSARLPVYILFVQIFFKEHKELIILSLYIIGIIFGVISSAVLKKFFFPKEDTPLVMELPLYRFPSIKNIGLYATIKTGLFLKKAGTVILLFSIIIWFLSAFPFGVKYASEESFIGIIGEKIAPIYHFAGFGFKEAVISLLFGVVAKELVVSTLATLFGGNLSMSIQSIFTPLSAYSFLLATLVSVPCIATLGAIKKEIGTKWMIFSLIYMLSLGWLLATIFYQIGGLFYG